VAHLPSPQRWPTCELAQWPLASPHGLPFFSLADVRTPPSSPSVGEAGRALPSSSYRHASLVHHPSPTPWREVDPPRPLPLPLLYWLPSPPPLPVTDAHRHQWRRLHFTVARSRPSPSAPIKGAPVVPHLTAPHTTLLFSSHAPEPTPTARLQSPPLCRHDPVTSPSLHLRCGHPRHHHVPLSLLRPLRRPPVSCSTCAPCSVGRTTVLLAAPPRSTVDRAPDVVHRPWTESTDYSIQQ
jgi:hypothetical protein